jgi:hypothetical protein
VSNGSAAARYYVVASMAMIIYDIFLTFSIEVERVWKQPWSLAKGLWMFVSTRKPNGLKIQVVDFDIASIL